MSRLVQVTEEKLNGKVHETAIVKLLAVDSIHQVFDDAGKGHVHTMDGVQLDKRETTELQGALETSMNADTTKNNVHSFPVNVKEVIGLQGGAPRVENVKINDIIEVVADEDPNDSRITVRRPFNSQRITLVVDETVAQILSAGNA